MLSARGREMQEKAGTAFSDAKEMIQDQKSRIMAAVEAGKEAMCAQESKSPESV